MSFATVLIANRGEIACRVIRTAHRLGYRTVAVFSVHDACAPHVQQADAAVAVPGYLDIAAMIDAARRSGADAVHPGYGFLSERADFAEACAAAGLVFIGPPAAAIRAMGDKARAKRQMQAAGVPCAPGTLGQAQDLPTLQGEAQALGLPLLVKATAGGGGRGMRLVRRLDELEAALTSARREAEAAFGDGSLMLERLIEDGRHIEVQVVADTHGHVIPLGERDCSTQRRRQKVIEEAPSPSVTPALRQALGRDAVAAARAVGYVGAGTVEFIVDAHGGHHFLEMNTRLQVEHPVTECLTGLDLVEWQLRVAAGEALPTLTPALQGHAIEARLYAEDPAQGWQPQTGRVLHWQPQDAGIRVDHGLAEGMVVTPHYDPLLAKFIAHGRDRPDAIRRLRRALADAPLLGLTTNAGFLRELLAHPQFAAGHITTGTLDGWAAGPDAMLQPVAPPEDLWRIAAAVLGGAQRSLDLHLQCGDTRRVLRTPAPGVQVLAFDAHRLQVSLDGVQRRFTAVRSDDGPARALHIAHEGRAFVFVEASPWPGRDERPDPRRVCAPVAGTLAVVQVAVGDAVAAGQALACVEAMKMEMWLKASAAGTVVAVHRQPGRALAAGELLIELDIPA